MKKICYNILATSFTYIAILLYFKYFFEKSSYNILLSLLYFIILYFYFKNNFKHKKKEHNYSLILSLIISICLSIGNTVSLYLSEPAVNIFGVKNIFKTIIMIIGFTILFYKIFYFMFTNIKKINLFEKHEKMSTKYFFLINISILFVYSLYFIRFYPAIMTNDSYYVLHYANNFILSDFHSFGHTWFIGIFFHLGKFIFHDINMAVGFAIIIQMICMSIIFSLAIRYLYNKGLKKSVCIVLLLIYMLNPLHAHYSITLWRDIMFGGSFVILFISLYEFAYSNKIKYQYIILFIIGTLIMLFFRNNGIYIYIFTIPFIIIILKNKRYKMSILCFSLLIIYFIIKGPIFNYFGVEKTTSVEAYSIPLQQIARVISSGKEIDNNDREFLEKLFNNYNDVPEKYSNALSDPIKNITNNDYLSNNKVSFFKTYLHLFFKYPNIYFEAHCLQTLGYWYPDVIYWATAGESKGIFETEKIYNTPLTPQWYNKIIDKTILRELPLSNLIWSVGLQFLLLIISTFIMIYTNNKKYLLSIIPVYGLWLSIMVASPVFCELRYVYGLFTCMPLILAISGKTKIKSND